MSASISISVSFNDRDYEVSWRETTPLRGFKGMTFHRTDLFEHFDIVVAKVKAAIEEQQC